MWPSVSSDCSDLQVKSVYICKRDDFNVQYFASAFEDNLGLEHLFFKVFVLCLVLCLVLCFQFLKSHRLNSSVYEILVLLFDHFFISPRVFSMPNFVNTCSLPPVNYFTFAALEINNFPHRVVYVQLKDSLQIH